MCSFDTECERSIKIVTLGFFWAEDARRLYGRRQPLAVSVQKSYKSYSYSKVE